MKLINKSWVIYVDAVPDLLVCNGGMGVLIYSNVFDRDLAQDEKYGLHVVNCFSLLYVVRANHIQCLFVHCYHSLLKNQNTGIK